MMKSHLLSFFALGSVHPTEPHLWWLRCQAWFELRGQIAVWHKTNHQFSPITHVIWRFFSLAAIALESA